MQTTYGYHALALLVTKPSTLEQERIVVLRRARAAGVLKSSEVRKWEVVHFNIASIPLT